MDSVTLANQRQEIVSSIMLDGKIRFHHLAEGFLLGIFIFPTYFGLRFAGFDLTVLRLFEVFLFLAIFKNPLRKRQFVKLVFNTRYFWIVMPYFIVVLYTNLYRGSFTGWFYTLFNVIFVFFLLLYLGVYEYTVEQLGRKIVGFTWILCLLSPMELVFGLSPFAFLDTLNKSSSKMRFGVTRIMGNTTTCNGYGLYLMLLLPLICIDWKTKKINLLHNPPLLILLLLNAVLTGSRLAIGAAALEILLILLFSPRKVRNWGIFWGVFSAAIGMSFLFATQGFSFSRSLLMTIFAAVDEVFNTSISTYYGADETYLNGSSYYRELLWKNTFFGGWLNPIMGRGEDYFFSMYIEGYKIASTDNYYAGTYITYAWPGVIALIYIGWKTVAIAFINATKEHSIFARAVLVSIIGYYISLWYLDHLQTFPIFIGLSAIVCAQNFIFENKRFDAINSNVRINEMDFDLDAKGVIK